MLLAPRIAIVTKRRSIDIREVPVRQVHGDVEVRIALCGGVQTRFRGVEYGFVQLLLGRYGFAVEGANLGIRQWNLDRPGLRAQSKLVAAQPRQSIIDEDREAHVKGKVRRLQVKSQHDPLGSFGSDDQRSLI